MKLKVISKSVALIFFVSIFVANSSATRVYAKSDGLSIPQIYIEENASKSSSFSQSSYYQEPYTFKIGWNLNKKAYDAYSDKIDIVLSNNKTISVSFDSSCKDYIKDKKAMSALKELMEKLVKDNPSLEKPFIVSVGSGVSSNSEEEEKYSSDSQKYIEDDDTEAYTFSQSSYYQKPYIFEIGWNLNKEDYSAYDDKIDIVLSNNKTVSVSFDTSCKNYIKDKKAINELKKLIKKLVKDNPSRDNPLIVSIENVGDNDLNNLAEEYYSDGKLNSFVSIFSELDSNIKIAYCNRMFDDNKIAFLSASLKFMDNDTINFCVRKAYEESKLNFFASIVPCIMDDDIINLYVKRAYEDDKLTFFSNIAPYLTDEAKQAWIVKASKDKKNTFLSILTDD